MSNLVGFSRQNPSNFDTVSPGETMSNLGGFSSQNPPKFDTVYPGETMSNLVRESFEPRITIRVNLNFMGKFN